jgi:hypothetical protein
MYFGHVLEEVFLVNKRVIGLISEQVEYGVYGYYLIFVYMDFGIL